MTSALKDLEDLAHEALRRWDAYQRPGKILIALMGQIPGNDPRVDRVRAALAATPATPAGSPSGERPPERDYSVQSRGENAVDRLASLRADAPLVQELDQSSTNDTDQVVGEPGMAPIGVDQEKDDRGGEAIRDGLNIVGRIPWHSWDPIAGKYRREPPTTTAPVAIQRSSNATGDLCSACGGPNLFRSGACMTCADCGTSSGCS